MPDVITVFLNKDDDNDDDEISGLTCNQGNKANEFTALGKRNLVRFAAETIR